MTIPELGTIKAFAMIVDINHFTRMVAEDDTGLIAQFVRDVLSGPIAAIESCDGEVVGYMGDAILGVLPTGDGAAFACFDIAKDLDRQCEYIFNHQEDFPQDWAFAPGGPSIKIAIEYGSLDVSTISSRFLGTHRLLIGDAINYASRITSGGVGNRCHIGPIAAAMAPFSGYTLHGPRSVRGKAREGVYTYYELDLSDIWVEGRRKKGKETFLG
ncbi:MAG: adenylate/guanylate cyclase domain-containing protein [Verrucomicrobiota bacterium]